MLISIIVPCYNSEKYLQTLYQTLVKQTCTFWEVICIDDGSIDDTKNIIIRYASQDSRIRYFYQENQGAAKAREKGIVKAEGDYITFLDADDTIPADYLQKLLEAFSLDIDIVSTGFNIIRNDRIIKCKKYREKRCNKIEYLKRVLCGKYGWELCGKMFRKELFNNSIHTPVDIRIGEDAAVFIQLVSYARNIQIIEKPLYNYIQYEKSASHVQSFQYAEETLKAGFFIRNILQSKEFYTEVENEVKAMQLLFFSNSTRKAFLGNNFLVKEVYKDYYKIAVLRLLPLKKSFYMVLYRFCGKYISEILFK